MAQGRKRMEEPMLKSWDQADEALKEIAEAEHELDMLHSAMNMQVDALKKQFDEAAKPYHEKVKKNELLVKEFASSSREQMDGKSKKLTFGTVGFRMSTKLGLPKDVAKVIKNLRKYGMEKCITTKESVNKDILKTYEEKDILKVGGKLQKEDTFFYELNKIETQAKE